MHPKLIQIRNSSRLAMKQQIDADGCLGIHPLSFRAVGCRQPDLCCAAFVNFKTDRYPLVLEDRLTIQRTDAV